MRRIRTTRLRGSNQDITEQRTAEQAVRGSNQDITEQRTAVQAIAAAAADQEAAAREHAPFTTSTGKSGMPPVGV